MSLTIERPETEARLLRFAGEGEDISHKEVFADIKARLKGRE